MTQETEFPLNDLPKHSPWPARILGIDTWSRNPRTEADLIREFEKEKWGILRKQISEASKKFTVKDADHFFVEGASPTLRSREDHLVLLGAQESIDAHYSLVEKNLAPWLPEISAISELGAGYGSVLLRLAQKFRNKHFFGGEFTQGGVDCIRLLAEAEALPVEAGLCDLSGNRSFSDMKIPENALIYTSFAVMYLDSSNDALVERFLALKPRVVVNFEPIYEHSQDPTLLSFLRRRYLELNYYNKNYLTVLQEMEKKRRIRILDCRKNLYGTNPLLPCSVITWEPIQ